MLKYLVQMLVLNYLVLNVDNDVGADSGNDVGADVSNDVGAHVSGNGVLVIVMMIMISCFRVNKTMKK